MIQHKFCSLILPLLIVSFAAHAQAQSTDEYIYDTTNINVFEGAENANFKLNYYHTDGYSTGNRYWYEVIIIDSLMMLNFKSPDNDDWNYISYHKQIILDDSTLSSVKSQLKTLKIGQKKKGRPKPLGSGYGADVLYIQSKDLNVAGGTTYMCVGEDITEKEYSKKIIVEKEQSSSISGDYETLFKELISLFDGLTFLLKDKDK